jgi:hypothetical protein
MQQQQEAGESGLTVFAPIRQDRSAGAAGVVIYPPQIRLLKRQEPHRAADEIAFGNDAKLLNPLDRPVGAGRRRPYISQGFFGSFAARRAAVDALSAL